MQYYVAYHCSADFESVHFNFTRNGAKFENTKLGISLPAGGMQKAAC